MAVLVAIRKVKTEYASDLKQLLADVKEALGALEALNCPVCHWDYLITFMVVRKLDPELLKDWEKLLGAKTTPPNFDELEAFLVGRIHVLEALEHATLPRKLGQQLLRRELPLLPDRIPRPLPNSSVRYAPWGIMSRCARNIWRKLWLSDATSSCQRICASTASGRIL